MSLEMEHLKHGQAASRTVVGMVLLLLLLLISPARSRPELYKSIFNKSW